MSDRWQVWYSSGRKDRWRPLGICIVHRASDAGLRLEENGLDDRDREEYCKRLCDVLNKAKMP